MSTVLSPVDNRVPDSTPSKVAAAKLESLDLTKPDSLAAKMAATEDAKKTLRVKKDDDVKEQGRDRFVGNLDIKSDADEPLLKPTEERFVLFPIKYHEVR